MVDGQVVHAVRQLVRPIAIQDSSGHFTTAESLVLFFPDKLERALRRLKQEVKLVSKSVDKKGTVI